MNTSLQQRIQSADLTRTEKRIADYFLDHSESLYFMTARDIAQELGVKVSGEGHQPAVQHEAVGAVAVQHELPVGTALVGKRQFGQPGGCVRFQRHLGLSRNRDGLPLPAGGEREK